ncbi:MAG: Na+/H+ antiporter NhaC family protein [Fuerstiella sp.]
MFDAQLSAFVLIDSLPWLRLAPPVVAISLAIALRDVNFALLLATFAGCLLVTGLDFSAGVTTFCDVFVETLADTDHAAVILFTVLLGAMIGLMNDSGGTTAVVNRMTRYANTRPKGQILTWLCGLIVFFDDYANTMLIGGSMRPLADRLRISRAKLAFLIDATAAPVAGLALSTWTAFEIDQVTAGLAAAGVDADSGQVFFATIPYRLYPILAILTVAAIACSGRDFGAMLKAEQAAQTLDQSEQPTVPSIQTGSVWFAAIPVAVLVTVVVIGYLRDVDAYRLLLIASLGASTVAVVLPLLSGRLNVTEAARSWTEGITSMIPAVVVLILAWAVSDVCREGKLDTAGYIISLVGDSVQPEFLPAIAFLAAGAIAVSIGSSFTTMALLVPLFIPLAWTVLSGHAEGAPTVNHPVFLATVGAILAGAIFGDHCSPISDTTVLSSAAAGCDHLQHVATQLPYAILVAACSVLLGYLPIGFGIPWWISLPVSAMACIGAILFLGQQTKTVTSEPGKLTAVETAD